MLDWADINSAPGVYDFQHLDTFLKSEPATERRRHLYVWKNASLGILSTVYAGPYGPGQCAPPADLKELG